MEPLATGVVTISGSKDKNLRVNPNANSPVSIGSSSQVSSTSHSSTSNSQSNSSMSSGLGASTQSIVSNKQKIAETTDSKSNQPVATAPKASIPVNMIDIATPRKKSTQSTISSSVPKNNVIINKNNRNNGGRSQIYNQISEFSKEMEQLNKSAANLQVHELVRKNESN
jgi:hypothetical protein